MPAITPTRFQASYSLAKAVCEGTLTEPEAVQKLVADHGMDRGSAYGYVRQLAHFLSGTTYTRTINDPATRHYLERIAADFGPHALKSALDALAGHLEYYEAKASKRPSLRAILAEFRDRIGKDEAVQESELEKAVEASLSMSAAERAKHLPSPGTKPATTTVTLKAFLRNPHVIAAAHVRANGVCERCDRKAPFLKKSNGTPYLEIHHRITLANDGDDTVDNVLALCPNCHRELHCG